MKIYELIPMNGRKSFYGKAIVIEKDGWTFLKSYNTIVCGIDSSNGFHRFWNGWSDTTGKQIKSFRGGIGNKKDWDSFPVEPLPECIR